MPDQKEDDEDQDFPEEGLFVMHGSSKREIEPDYSGYVDEYRFIPLTPSLGAALATIVESVTVSDMWDAGKHMAFGLRHGRDERE